MRILLWYWGRRGGGAQYALCLARALTQQPGVTLDLSVSSSLHLLDDFRALDARLDVVPTFTSTLGGLLGLFRTAKLRRRLVRQAREADSDVVLSAMSHIWTPLVAPALTAARIPFVPAIHDAQPHPGDPAVLWDWRLRTELRVARAALTFSSSVEATVRRIRPDLQTLRMPLGAHLPFPAPGSMAVVEREFLFFGRFRAYKGLDLLRDAFRLLRARHPEATLRVVGEGNVEACAPGLSSMPGVTVQARWVSEEEMPSLIARAWAVVLPYREASQSGVLPLALALGVPVVATPVGALAEQLRSGTSGVVAEDVTAAALAEAMTRLLVPGARATLSDAARRDGAALTDWGAQAATLVEGLRGLGLGESGRR